jgi:hypothetical protein
MQVKSTKLAKVLFVLIDFIIVLQDLVSREKSAANLLYRALHRGSEARRRAAAGEYDTRYGYNFGFICILRRG